MSNSTEVKVFANIGDDPITFETPQDFNLYYERNKKSVDSFSTRGLNRKFIIPSYKIGRKRGEIILYPVQNQANHQSTSENIFDERSMIEEKIDSMNERLKKIELQLQMILNSIQRDTSQMRADHLAISQNQSSMRFYKN